MQCSTVPPINTATVWIEEGAFAFFFVPTAAHLAAQVSQSLAIGICHLSCKVPKKMLSRELKKPRGGLVGFN